jgi:hypothetical protein
MTEVPKPGLLEALGQICEEMQISGCDYQTALERRQQRQQEEAEEFADTNIVSFEEFRKKRFHSGI